jgi:hypothetical protein
MFRIAGFYGTSLELASGMRRIVCLAAVAALAACRNEPIPRDYQNNPPAMTHPVTKSSDTPTAHGMPGPAPEPSKGAEGQNPSGKPTSPTSPSTTIRDQAPTTTQTSGRVVTGTHLSARP